MGRHNFTDFEMSIPTMMMMNIPGCDQQHHYHPKTDSGYGPALMICDEVEQLEIPRLLADEHDASMTMEDAHEVGEPEEELENRLGGVVVAPAVPTSTSSSFDWISKPPAPNHEARRWSCEFCRKRKVKCDSQRPVCGRCISKGHPEMCVYLGAPRRYCPPKNKKKLSEDEQEVNEDENDGKPKKRRRRRGRYGGLNVVNVSSEAAVAGAGVGVCGVEALAAGGGGGGGEGCETLHAADPMPMAVPTEMEKGPTVSIDSMVKVLGNDLPGSIDGDAPHNNDRLAHSDDASATAGTETANVTLSTEAVGIEHSSTAQPTPDTPYSCSSPHDPLDQVQTNTTSPPPSSISQDSRQDSGPIYHHQPQPIYTPSPSKNPLSKSALSLRISEEHNVLLTQDEYRAELFRQSASAMALNELWEGWGGDGARAGMRVTVGHAKQAGGAGEVPRAGSVEQAVGVRGGGDSLVKEAVDELEDVKKLLKEAEQFQQRSQIHQQQPQFEHFEEARHHPLLLSSSEVHSSSMAAVSHIQSSYLSAPTDNNSRNLIIDSSMITSLPPAQPFPNQQHPIDLIHESTSSPPMQATTALFPVPATSSNVPHPSILINDILQQLNASPPQLAVSTALPPIDIQHLASPFTPTPPLTSASMLQLPSPPPPVAYVAVTDDAQYTLWQKQNHQLMSCGALGVAPVQNAAAGLIVGPVPQLASTFPSHSPTGEYNNNDFGVYGFLPPTSSAAAPTPSQRFHIQKF
ncbi:hypothetical protein HDV05_004244 [Chytridiales sp. JEL 0842]|nr:hypothetical protein HDV05_004244 [Chytridiales sp. JEL 0842]